MQAKIEKIGDGFGLILPKELLDACGFGSEANVAVQDKSLIVTAQPRRAREGWAEALARIPQEDLDRDFEELQAFRETPDEGKRLAATGGDGQREDEVNKQLTRVSKKSIRVHGSFQWVEVCCGSWNTIVGNSWFSQSQTWSRHDGMMVRRC